jgi:hypothetical protein
MYNTNMARMRNFLLAWGLLVRVKWSIGERTKKFGTHRDHERTYVLFVTHYLDEKSTNMATVVVVEVMSDKFLIARTLV